MHRFKTTFFETLSRQHSFFTPQGGTSPENGAGKRPKVTVCHQGFTLMEILVAIFIFTVLFTVLFGSFQTLSSSSDALGRGTDQFEMGQQCISRIAKDMEAITVSLPPQFKQPDFRETTDPYRILGESETVNGKTVSRLRFTTLAHFSFSESQVPGIAEIVYYVHPIQNGELVLRRSDHLYPYETFEEKSSDPIICKNIQGFSLTYFNGEGEASEEWDSESSEEDYTTPRSIQVVLQIGDEAAPNVFSTRVYIPVYREKKS